VRQSLAAAASPILSCPVVEHLGERLGQPVGELAARFDVVLGFTPAG
jgi:hypothetical protein